MKKKMKWIAVLTAFALGFAACDNGSGDDSTTDGGNTTTQTDGTTEEQGGADDGSDDSGNGGNSDTTTDPTDPANPSDDDDSVVEIPRVEATGKIGIYEKPYAVGDIVFSDGSATPYASDLTLTDEQKAAAIAVIFYVGTDLNSSDDTTTSRTLGVGLVHNRSGLAWCTSSANAYSKNITTIQCPASGSAGALTFTGDKNGSDNLSQIAAFLAANSSTDDSATAANYPAFYFAKNYASQTGSHVIGTDYATDWYLPTIAELFQIWKNKTTVDAASDLCGGSQFGTYVYWSSSQIASNDNTAYFLNFYIGDWLSSYKDYTLSVCAVRAFN